MNLLQICMEHIVSNFECDKVAQYQFFELQKYQLPNRNIYYLTQYGKIGYVDFNIIHKDLPKYSTVIKTWKRMVFKSILWDVLVNNNTKNQIMEKQTNISYVAIAIGRCDFCTLVLLYMDKNNQPYYLPIHDVPGWWTYNVNIIVFHDFRNDYHFFSRNIEEDPLLFGINVKCDDDNDPIKYLCDMYTGCFIYLNTY
uniref:ORF102 n=1 Tax=Spodoptera frugiperda granulovirus TaxID=307454 RepID=A0A346QW22_9BBAC|nr:ORF102 [Spodoptera frugiperda granulovirus]